MQQQYQQPQQLQYQQQSPPPQMQGGYAMPQQQPQQQYMSPAGTPGVAPVAQATNTQFQNATPIASLNRSAAPADCPACGQRSMTQVAYEIGNSTQYVLKSALVFLLFGYLRLTCS